MDDMIEQRYRKIESEELLRIFSITLVIGAQKVTEENKDRKNFSSCTSKFFLFTAYRT